jgi:hypothetical protein
MLPRTLFPKTTVWAVMLAAAASLSCAKQGEGERCDPNSGNLDCESGLICRSGEQLNIGIGVGTGFALCCPPDGVAPTVNACRAGADLPDEQLPVDAGGDGG